MNAIVIKPVTIAELEAAPNIYALLDEYAAESAIEGLPHPSAKAETYKNLEASGWLKAFAAWKHYNDEEDDELVGFITVLSPVMPHYDQLIATVESFFVAHAHRSSGAGIKLKRTAEDHAQAIGSPGLLICAPNNGGSLATLLSLSSDYTETNRVFFKRFA